MNASDCVKVSNELVRLGLDISRFNHEHIDPLLDGIVTILHSGDRADHAGDSMNWNDNFRPTVLKLYDRVNELSDALHDITVTVSRQSQAYLHKAEELLRDEEPSLK